MKIAEYYIYDKWDKKTFTINGKAKFVFWDMVDKGVFKGLKRNGNPIVKTYNGDKSLLMDDVMVPQIKSLQEH